MTPKASTPPALRLLSIGSRPPLIVPCREKLKPIPNRPVHANIELKETALAKTEPFRGRPRPPDHLLAFLQALGLCRAENNGYFYS
jgi:hypothetical protein